MSELTHVGPGGEARMVDVSAKPATARFATAAGAIRMQGTTLAAIRENTLAKGDVLAVAKVAGVMAAKRTADLVPLCHPVALTDVQVTLTPDPDLPGLQVVVTARTTGPTGVEMEALTAVAVTLITIFDMAKAVDKSMVLLDIRLIEKAGGKSGHWHRGRAEDGPGIANLGVTRSEALSDRVL